MEKYIYWRRCKIQETFYIRQWHLSPVQSRYLGPHTVLSLFKTLCNVFCWNCYQLSHCIFLNLINGLKSFSFQRWFKKLEVTGHQILALGAAESPGWFDVSTKYSTGDRMHKRAHCHDTAANHQLPTAAAFWIIPIVSTECSSVMWNLMQICCSTCSVILNVMTTQYICSLNGIYHALTSTVKSSLLTHVHSSPLSSMARLPQCFTNWSCYINNSWTFSRQTLYIWFALPQWSFIL